MLINLRPSSYFMGSNVNLGSFEVTEATVSRSVSRSSSTSFCQPHYLMFLQSAWTNFDETWSQWPITKRADVQWPLTRSKVIQGQRGQKSIFSPKRIKSTRFHGMFTILIHMIAYNALYKSYRIKNSSGVIWGHRGQKVIRIQKNFKKSYLLGAI